MRHVFTALSVAAAMGLGLASISPALAGPTDEQSRQEGLPMPAQQQNGHWVFVPNGTAAPNNMNGNSGYQGSTQGQAQDRSTGTQQQ